MDSGLLKKYAVRLAEAINRLEWAPIEALALAMKEARATGNTVWICGNGGSAANAIHWANDFLYPVVKHGGKGLRIQALPGNPAVLTCLGNDLGYDTIFSRQLETNANKGDLLVALSGSGNSGNILEAIAIGKEIGMKSFALVGFDGGKAKSAADVAIHFDTDDMQVAEDLQMVVCHMLVQCLYQAFKN